MIVGGIMALPSQRSLVSLRIELTTFDMREHQTGLVPAAVTKFGQCGKP